MRSPAVLAAAAVLLVAARAHAQGQEPAPEPVAASAPSAPAAESAEALPIRHRDSGIRLSADLGFERASSSLGNSVTEGSPSLIPLGLELAFHTSERMLWGLHGFYGLSSRDDCLRSDSCIGRGYGAGGQLEVTLGSGPTWIPWFRYGLGVESIYHGGTVADRGGHTFRTGFDLVDARIGADYVLSRAPDGKLTRLGGYVGMIAGMQVSETGAASKTPQSFAADGGDGYVWFTIGVRGTIDP